MTRSHVDMITGEGSLTSTRCPPDVKQNVIEGVGRLILTTSQVDVALSMLIAALISDGQGHLLMSLTHSVDLARKKELLSLIGKQSSQGFRDRLNLNRLNKRIDRISAARNTAAHGVLDHIDGQWVLIPLGLRQVLRSGWVTDAVKVSDLASLADAAEGLAKEVRQHAVDIRRDLIALGFVRLGDEKGPPPPKE